LIISGRVKGKIRSIANSVGGSQTANYRQSKPREDARVKIHTKDES